MAGKIVWLVKHQQLFLTKNNPNDKINKLLYYKKPQ